MNMLQSIGLIAGSIGVIVLMFFIFKWINSRKIKTLEKSITSLKEKNSALESRNAGLVNQISQLKRQQSAASGNMARTKRTKAQTKKLQHKIDKAHTDEEILELMDYIDNDNNEVIKK